MAKHWLLRALVICTFLGVLLLLSPAVLGLDEKSEIDRALLLSNRGDVDRAIQILSQILTRSPGNVAARVERGNVFFTHANWRMAKLDMEKLVLVIPNYQHGYVLLGICNDRMQNYNQALKMYDKAIACGGPETGTTYRAEGLTLLNLGRVAEARAAVSKAMAFHVHMPEQQPFDRHAMGEIDRYGVAFPPLRSGSAMSSVVVKAEILHRQERENECLSLLSDVLQKEPNNPQAHAIRGGIYANSLEYDKAIAEMTKVVEFEPHYQHAYLVIGECHFQLEHYPQSLDFLQRAIKCGGIETGRAHRDMSSTYLKMGRLKEARAEVDQAIKLDAGGDTVAMSFDLDNSQQICLALKDYPGIVQVVTKKLALSAIKHCEDWRERGQAYLHLGKLDLATKDFLDALKQCQGDRDSMEGLITIYQKQGNKKALDEMKARLHALDANSY